MSKKDLTCVVLTGLPGSGKTTCGAILAERLGFAFLDCDRLIEEAEGRKIKEIFLHEGEPYFRKVENQLLMLIDELKITDVHDRQNTVSSQKNIGEYIDRELALRKCVEHVMEDASKRGGLIMSAGGGMPEPEVNQKILQKIATVVYLEIQPDDIAGRISADGSRPLLSGQVGKCDDDEQENNLCKRLSKLLERRKDAYEKADIKIAAGTLSPSLIAGQIEEALTMRATSTKERS